MSIWVVSQKFTLLSHVWGQRRFLVSGNILSKIFHHARGAKPKRIFFPDTFFTLLRQGRLIHLPSKTNIKIRIKNGENDYEKESEKIICTWMHRSLTLTTAGCSSSTSSNASEADTTAETSQEASADKEIYNVAIVKQLDHASLDEIANAVEAELDKIAEDNNVTIHYELYSGQNDQTTLKQIGDQAVADGVDAIIPIATLAAQVATVSAQQTQTPVVYAAVSDPEAAELTGIDYVTGTSDALNTEKIMDMILPQTQMLKMWGFYIPYPRQTQPNRSRMQRHT